MRTIAGMRSDSSGDPGIPSEFPTEVAETQGREQPPAASQLHVSRKLGLGRESGLELGPAAVNTHTSTC